MAAYLKTGRKTGISPPTDTRNIIGFPIGPVHCQKNIRNLPSQRRLTVDRHLADKPVQKDLIGLGILHLFFNELQFPDKDGQYQPVLLFLMAVIGTELSGRLDICAPVILVHIDQPFGNHQRYHIAGVA